MIKRIIGAICIFLFMHIITGCSTKAKNVSASYVSPLQYQHYNCNQIGQELLSVNRRVLEVTGQQDKAANKDKVALGVGLVLFWPALFFMIGGDKKKELGKLKGEYEALQTAAISKECDVAEEMQIAQKQQAEYEESTRVKRENDVVEEEHIRLKEKFEYYSSQKCLDDVAESKTLSATEAANECMKATNLYSEKLALLKENPGGYFYKLSQEKSDSSIMSNYHKSENKGDDQ